ncbi:pentatricopeptide repeat-containing protein At4g04790, mitochondrial-like [Carica papaya]|uniref:pentatricopeptide repeat-containing protein At4g04790, mitochondrial-like n=1 Tax=Carica papaya TaxID=3649 RepID=UPI000B8D16F6|nr:pentatricopeptide repeat-containing protein At4g04790, mitochondrial-like [Carica papaya]
MAASKAKSLSSLFQEGLKLKAATKSPSLSSSSTALLISSVEDGTCRQVVSSPSIKSSEPKKLPQTYYTLPSLNLDPASTSGESAKPLCEEISSMLAAGSPDSLQDNKGNSIKKLEIPWFPSVSSINISVKRKEISRERKRKFIFNNSHVNRFKKLVTSCADKLGTDATIKIFGKLGRETGIKEYNALIGVYIRNARTSIDLEVALEQIGKAFELLKLMKEQGFQIGDTTYGPLLMYLIDMGMIEEFQAFCEFIKDGTSGCLPRLGYYEMLLWIEVDNEQKIQELCNCIGSDIGEDISNLEGT